MAGEVVNSSFVLFKKICCMPTRKCFENRHKSYTQNVVHHLFIQMTLSIENKHLNKKEYF